MDVLDARFRRQHPMGQFILDLFCSAATLAIEIDGGIHTHQAEYDEARTMSLESYDIQVIRFQNDEVLHDLAGVVNRIRLVLESRLTPFASTPFQLEFSEWDALPPDE